MAHSKAQVEAMHAKGFCTAWEMAEASGLHLSTIHRYFTGGMLHGVRVGKAYFVEIDAAIKVWPALEPDIRTALADIFARSRERYEEMVARRATGRHSAPAPRIGATTPPPKPPKARAPRAKRGP